jgi:fructose-bisphosphate aldolase class 1
VSSRRQAQAEQAIIIAAAMLIPMLCPIVVMMSQYVAV